MLKKENTEDEKWEYLEEQFKKTWGSIPRTRYNLWRFLIEFKVGDIVLVPEYKAFSIYEITGSPILAISLIKTISYDNNIIKGNGKTISHNDEIIDIGFIIPVKEKYRKISRFKYADAKLTSRMKIRQTNANISDIKYSIEESIKSYIANRPISLYGGVIDNISFNLLENIRSYLDPDKFEYLIEWYFKKIGACKVEIPSKNEANKSKGSDADIVATFENLKVIILVQAKYHTDETDKWAVEQIHKYKEDKLESGDEEYTYINWALTSGDNFSDNAIVLAREKSVRLINGKDFAEMLIQVGLSNIDEAFK